MILETAHSSQTKLVGYDLHVSEQGIGYSNLTPDPLGARGTWGFILEVKFKFDQINCQASTGVDKKHFCWVIV